MADLRKEELFPADAIGLFYLQITRIPGRMAPPCRV